MKVTTDIPGGKMRKPSTRRVLAIGLASAVVAISAMTITAPPAHAAFSCDESIIDGAQSLTIADENWLDGLAGFFSLGGAEVHIVTTPNLRSDGEVVPFGEAGGGLSTDPIAIHLYLAKLKDYCPGWSEFNAQANELEPKHNLVIVALAPYNKLTAFVEGRGLPQLKNQEVDEIFAPITDAYDRGDPASGYTQGLWKLAYFLFWKQLMMLAASIIVGVVLVGWLIRRVRRRHPQGEEELRS